MFEEQHAMFGGAYSRTIDHMILRLDPATVPEQYRKQHSDGDFPVAFAWQYGKAAFLMWAGANSERPGTIRACRR